MNRQFSAKIDRIRDPARSVGARTLLFAAALCGALATGGCSDLPRNPEQTVDIIRERGQIRIGMVAGVARDEATETQLARAADKLGVAVARSEGPGEVLLGELERGELDLVYGRFATSSPWNRAVYIGRAPGWLPGSAPSDVEVPRFAFRNGENGWIMTLERLGQ